MENEPATASPARPSSPSTRVLLKAVICLVVGLGTGYLFRGLQSPASAKVPSANTTQQSTPVPAMGAQEMPSAERMKQMADTQAAPLLEKLKGDPNNTALLSQIGAIYHTTSQFKQAADYYGRAVDLDPRNVALRTKLASSLYRGGDVDGAIAQLNQALKYDSKDANALFDLGVIKLHGKQDGKGALAAWQQLLKSNPQLSADRKATVQRMMTAVMTMMSDQKGIQGARSDDGQKPNVN